MAAGSARVYWLGTPPAAFALERLTAALAGCETDLRVVTSALPDVAGTNATWLLDPGIRGEWRNGWLRRQPTPWKPS